MELGPNQTQWLTALRSGTYAQGPFSLRVGDNHCCLGVACEVFNVVKVTPWNSADTRYGDAEETTSAPKEIIELLQFYGVVGEDLDGNNSLAGMNDNGRTFAEIATIIETHPERYFRSPK